MSLISEKTSPSSLLTSSLIIQMIITSNNRQLIYIILHNQCPHYEHSSFLPSLIFGRGKFHCSIFQKHANGPSTGLWCQFLTLFRIGVRTSSSHQWHQTTLLPLQWDRHCPNLQIYTERRRLQEAPRKTDGELLKFDSNIQRVIRRRGIQVHWDVF